MEQRSEAKAREKVWELIRDIHYALLVTHDGEGGMHARPMVAQQEEFEGILWFFTSATYRKVEEIAHNNSVLLTYAEPKDQNYVSVRGKAEIITDKPTIASLWSEAMRTWFPKGVDDPDISLLRVQVESAEYWDSPSSALVYAYGYAKARLTGEPPQSW